MRYCLRHNWCCNQDTSRRIWKINSTEFKPFIDYDDYNNMMYWQQLRYLYGDERTFIYETEDNSIKIIQTAALYVLALNCGIIAYWFGQFRPIFTDFQTNHGAKNENGERIGQPRSTTVYWSTDPKNTRMSNSGTLYWIEPFHNYGSISIKNLYPFFGFNLR